MEWPWGARVMGREVILVRHGRTAWNAQHRFLGRTDVPLDDVGLAEARALAPLARHLDGVWASPLQRAQQTAASLGLPVLREGLAELDQGELEGLQPQEAIARWPAFFASFAEDPTDVCVPGGESMGALLRRAWAVLEAAPPGRTALVSHQMVIASLRTTIAGAPLRRWRKFSVRNASVTVLRDSGSGWVEVEGDWRPGGPTRHAV